MGRHEKTEIRISRTKGEYHVVLYIHSQKLMIDDIAESIYDALENLDLELETKEFGL